jgi:outer membrane lipoprotein-sorting protein
MKKLITAILVLVAFISSPAHAQEMSLDAVLAKYYQAAGIETVKEWKTLTMKGKSMAGGMEIPLTVTMKRPGKMRTEIELQGNKMLQVVDGESGWSVIPWSGSTDPQDMTADELKAMKDQTDLEGPLYNWKEKGHKVEMIGKEDMEGTPVYKIKVTRKNGNIETYFLDAESYLPLKIASIAKMQGNDVENETFSGNYQEVNGVMLPFSLETKLKGQTISNVVVDSYQVNNDVDDNLFLKPPKK